MRRQKRASLSYLPFYLSALAVSVWLGLLIAPYTETESWLFNVLNNMSEIFEKPFNVVIVENTVNSVIICSIICSLCLVAFISNDKNFRRGEEHGSSKWEDPHNITKKYRNNKNQFDNRIFSANVQMSNNTRKIRKNLFTLVVGGSGSGKTRYYCKPNIMQCVTSMIITDPKGENLRDTGELLKKKGYKIKVFDLINLRTSFRYNPFKYLRTETDVQKLVTNIFNNTVDKSSQKGDQFWGDAAQMLLKTIFFLIWYEAEEADQNFETVLALVLAEDVQEEDGMYEAKIPSKLELIIEDVREKNPEHIAVRYFDAYRKGAGKTIKSIIITLISRLDKFLIDDVSRLTMGDELELEKIGEEKTALFIVIPDNDSSFNFLAGMLYTQLFQILVYQADYVHKGALPIQVHFILDEFANISLPDDFQKLLATVRSRGITMSIVLQNISQLKSLFKEDWQSIMGNCDELLYLGGNESDSHKMLEEVLGNETIDTNSFGETRGRNGSSSKNYQNQARKLLESSEIRLKNKINNKDSAIIVMADEYPIIDEKYDINKHPNIKFTPDGGGKQYNYVKDDFQIKTKSLAVIDKYFDYEIAAEIIIES